MRYIVPLLFLVLPLGCAAPSGPPLETVPYVDLERYAGLWYEIARYPVGFERDCTGTTATYTLRDDGRVDVVNRCYKNSLTGSLDKITGTARVVDPDTNAKLKVSFFPLIEGDYWIIDLDEENYQWAVVGEPARRFLWILAREPQMTSALYDDITSRLPDKGYDPAELEMTQQFATDDPVGRARR